MDRPAGAEAKPWGFMIPLFDQPYTRADGTQATRCRIVKIYIEPGGYSSIHRHHQQVNTFFVQSGKLMLREFVFDGQVPVESSHAIMEADDHPLTFGAGAVHQFEALTAVEALEIYVAVGEGDACSSDIERFTENGVRRTIVADLSDDIVSRSLANMSEANRKQERRESHGGCSIE